SMEAAERTTLCGQQRDARADASMRAVYRRDAGRSTAAAGYVTPGRHKAAANIVRDASTKITIRMEWYRSHLLRSSFQSPGSASKSKAATRLLIGTRQISENGTVTTSKAADERHAHQDQVPTSRVSNERTTRSNAAAYQNGMTFPNRRARGLAASAWAVSWSFDSTGCTKTPIVNSAPLRSTVTNPAMKSIVCCTGPPPPHNGPDQLPGRLQ